MVFSFSLSFLLDVASGRALVDNVRVRQFQALVYPQLLLEELPLSAKTKQTVLKSRQEISAIIHGKDDRLIVVVGPCSIHDTAAATEYGNKLGNASVWRA